MRLRSLLIASLACVMVVTLGACGGGSDDHDASPTRPATATPLASTAAPATASPAATASSAIRAVDLQRNDDVLKVSGDTGGRFVQSNVLYADLTGDGVEEAIVPLESGGTLGDIAFLVFTPAPGGTAKTLLTIAPQDTQGLAIDIQDGNIVQTEPVYQPGDPECCPSLLRKSIYRWNGAALALEDVQTVPNPSGGPKQTPPVSP